MSLFPAEERKLQHRKIEQLDYISFLLEQLLHKTSPGRMELAEFQQFLKETHASQLRQKHESSQ